MYVAGGTSESWSFPSKQNQNFKNRNSSFYLYIIFSWLCFYFEFGFEGGNFLFVVENHCNVIKK